MLKKTLFIHENMRDRMAQRCVSFSGIPQEPIMKDKTCSLAFFIKRRTIHYACSSFFLHAYPSVKYDEKFHAGLEECLLIGSEEAIVGNSLSTCV